MSNNTIEVKIEVDSSSLLRYLEDSLILKLSKLQAKLLVDHALNKSYDRAMEVVDQ